MHVVTLGLERESESKHRTQNRAERILGPGLDLEYETEMQSNAPEPAQYETAYVTSHKGNCRSGAFSPDGQLCATGSVDASIKVLDVDRMLAKSNPESRGHLDQTGHPVIRTLYDHLEVNIIINSNISGINLSSRGCFIQIETSGIDLLNKSLNKYLIFVCLFV